MEVSPSAADCTGTTKRRGSPRGPRNACLRREGTSRPQTERGAKPTLRQLASENLGTGVLRRAGAQQGSCSTLCRPSYSRLRSSGSRRLGEVRLLFHACRSLWPVDPSARRHGRPMCVHMSPDRSEQPQRSCRSRRSTPSMGACGPKLSTPTEACPLGRCSSLVSCQAGSCASPPPHTDLHFLPLVTQQPFTAELSGRPEMLKATARVRHPSHVGVDRAADQDLRSEA